MFTDIDLKKTYGSEKDNLLEEFYIPVLKKTTSYKRLTGFFSSNSLLLAAEGIATFFSNGGRYFLISGVELSEEDYEACERGIKTFEKIIDEHVKFDLKELKSEIEADHLKVMSWLLSENLLQIKIAVMTRSNSGIFHEKVGILEDKDGNLISFSGSINETGGGWASNIEEFKVFRSWFPGEKEYLNKDLDKFNSYWNNQTKNFKVINLPTALRGLI